MPTLSVKNLTTSKSLWLILGITLWLSLHGACTKAQAGEAVTLPPQTVASGDASFILNVELPAGHKLNQEAPSTVGISSGDKNIVALDDKYSQNLPVANLPLCLTVPVKEGKTTLQATFRLNFCDEKLGICYLKEVQLTLPVEVSKTSKNKKLEMTHKIKAD
jgi:hypothetical protein